MKKITSYLLTLLLVFTLTVIPSQNSVKAIDSDTYKDKTHQYCTKVKIKQYYSYSKCKSIVKKAKNYKSATPYAKHILAQGAAKIPLSIFLKSFSNSCTQIKNFYQKAVNKKKGVEISYTYHIGNNSAAHHAVNFTKKYT